MLEAIRRRGKQVRFYQAATSEMFGEPEETPQDERTPFRPVNPYAAAKLYAFSLVGAYRRAYRMRASQRHPLQPRESLPGSQLRHPQDRSRGGTHRGRTSPIT